MFEWAMDFLKENQPVSYTGILAHCYYWVTSPAGGYAFKNPHFKPSSTEDPIGIYCLHGTADNSKSFLRVAERLINRKLPPEVNSVHLVQFEGRYAGNSIEYFSEQLIAQIIKNGHHRVIFLGHSRGGLVGAHAINLASSSNITVEMVIGIGTPFHGSAWAGGLFSWMSTSVQQMEMGNIFLHDLANEVTESSVKCYFFVGGQDYIVGEGNSYLKTYVEKNPDSLVILPRHGHLSLMSSHVMVDKIKLFMEQMLGRGEPQIEQTTPDSDDPDDRLPGPFDITYV